MRVNGTKITPTHIGLVCTIIFAVLSQVYSFGLLGAEIKSGLKNHNKRICELEVKQDAIWEMVRTQHVFDSLVALASGDSMFLKAVDIVENGDDEEPDTLNRNEYSTDGP